MRGTRGGKFLHSGAWEHAAGYAADIPTAGRADAAGYAADIPAAGRAGRSGATGREGEERHGI